MHGWHSTDAEAQRSAAVPIALAFLPRDGEAHVLLADYADRRSLSTGRSNDQGSARCTALDCCGQRASLWRAPMPACISSHPYGRPWYYSSSRCPTICSVSLPAGHATSSERYIPSLAKRHRRPVSSSAPSKRTMRPIFDLKRIVSSLTPLLPHCRSIEPNTLWR